MVKQIDFRTAIRTALLTVCDNVYYGKAKGTPTDGEYLVFMLDRTYRENAETASLTVNVVGRGNNTSDVEELADDVWELFNHYYYIDNNMQFAVYQSNRNDVTEADDTIIYRRLTFDILLNN